ncbi:recombinase family protein [Amphritea sp. HPY]|uniref:recombinase family protein n=1 Tax=Amphritea sp. HPY TaxID=3421652 RepID=UPI003D7CC28E
MTDIAYLRVPSAEEDVAPQLATIGQQMKRTFIDKCRSGRSERPALRKLRSYIRKGDVVHVSAIDRLARNLFDLRDLVREFNSKGVSVHFHQEQLTFKANDSEGTTGSMLRMVEALSGFERALVKEKQSEGIEKAKQRKAYKGRKPTHSVAQIKAALQRHDGNKTAAARDLGVSYRTVLRTCQKEGIE